jgi:hypothetical protein
MPGPPDDDDAPRWEPPAPSAEAPTWESTASEEAPTWESTAEIPRWEPDAETPRWKPDAATPAWVPPAAAAAAASNVGARFERPATGARPRPARPISPLARPFVWWTGHPWILVWALVVALPFVAIAMRLLDESNHQALVWPLAWAFTALGVAALAVAVVVRAPRAPARTAFGVLGALAAAAVLFWPVTRVTLDRTACPDRAGPDLGAPIAAAALDAWRAGQSGASRWRDGEVEAGWSDRARAFVALDHQLVDSGCWERVAPVDGSRTWHEFRVTVQRPEDNPLSKIVIVHTVRGGEGWKITAIEGPLP